MGDNLVSGSDFRIWDRKEDLTRNRNVTLACMANYKFRALQLHDRHSDSQCIV